MKARAAQLTALCLVLLAASGSAAAATAYVSDELVLGVFAEQNGQGQRLTTLHSGAGVETLSVNGEYTQVRLGDGQVGWVKSTYLTTREPATSRLKQLEEELDRTRATTPALAEAAAHSEVERLKRDLAAKQAELDAARAAGSPAVGAQPPATPADAPAAATAAAVTPDTPSPDSPAMPTATRTTSLRLSAAAVVIALGVGFWAGYATLARRVKHKFGGIKVY